MAIVGACIYDACMGRGRLAIAAAFFALTLCVPVVAQGQTTGEPLPAAPPPVEVAPEAATTPSDPVSVPGQTTAGTPGEAEEPSEEAVEPAPESLPDAEEDDPVDDFVPATGESDDAATARGGAPEATAAASADVDIVDYLFEPKKVTVTVGDSVTWTNLDPDPHDATADNESFGTKILEEGDSEAITFDEEGTFKYICSLHPPNAGFSDFVGTVEVVADSDSGGSGDNVDDFSPAIDTGITPIASSGSGQELADTGVDAALLLAIAGGLLFSGLLALAVREHLRWH